QAPPENDRHPRAERDRLFFEAMMRILDRENPGSACWRASRAAVLGSGEHRYRVVENWAKLPEGWEFRDVAAVAVDSKDRVYAFNRREDPIRTEARTYARPPLAYIV